MAKKVHRPRYRIFRHTIKYFREIELINITDIKYEYHLHEVGYDTKGIQWFSDLPCKVNSNSVSEMIQNARDIQLAAELPVIDRVSLKEVGSCNCIYDHLEVLRKVCDAPKNFKS